MKKISELEAKIRDFINHPRKQYQLLKNLTSWNQLCSSLDVIGDTELAIDAYIKTKPLNDNGSKYLLVYGILQCLFLQQAAVKHMAEALDIEYLSDPLLKHIRDIRNKSVGHPTKKESKEGLTFHFISRISLCKGGFTLMSSSSEENAPHFIDVDILALINNQQEKHVKILEQIISKLDEEEKLHKEKFANEKLMNIFPQTMSYYMEKVFEGIHSSDTYGNVQFAKMHINLIDEIIAKFKKALNERGLLPAYDGATYELEEITYPINELKNYFETPESSSLNKKSAYIFAYFVKEKLILLQKMAKEIDEEYSKTKT